MGTAELSETAFLIAWGRSTDPTLSLDPYAHLWLTLKGTAFSEKFAHNITPLAPYFFCLRNRYVLEQLRKFEKEFPIFTFINVGAGLTSYPFLLSETVSSIYLDQAHVLDFFKTRAERAIRAGKLPQRTIEYVAADLDSHNGLKKFEHLLARQTSPTFVLFEGILTYLAKPIALQHLLACAKQLMLKSRVEAHVGLGNFRTSHVWKKVGQFFDEELGLPAPELTCFDETEITAMPGMKLIEHMGFRDIQKRLGIKKDFTNDLLIDERFFLFEKT